MSATKSKDGATSVELTPKTLYLILYNFFCCLAWARILHLVLPVWYADPTSFFSLFTDSPIEMSILTRYLVVAQVPALLEIVHAKIGFVRSPVRITAIQVGSRIAALWAFCFSPNARVQWGAPLMVLSWALVEVPRYAFYMSALISGDATKGTPYPLFWLRYSLFAILYPTGITGELTVFLTAAKDPTFLNQFGPNFSTLVYCAVMFNPLIYIPGALPMIMNMASNRKKAFKKRFAKPPPPPRGLVFPKDAKGERSSTEPGKAILAAAVGASNKDKAEELTNEKKWRFKYVKYMKGLVEEQCKTPEAALDIASAGLKKAHESFEFISPDGSAVSLAEAMAATNTDKFETGYVKGSGCDETTSFSVPYKGKTLEGQELKEQVQKWIDYGTIEPSAGKAIMDCVDKPEWLKEIKKRYFVLLGAGSAMGPFEVLLSLGCNIIAIDLDRPRIWSRLISMTRKSTGSITFPLKKLKQSDATTDEELCGAAGCNLFTETPLIRDWLMSLYPEKSFVVGSYAYLNGAAHVQVSLAMDAICKDLSEKRKDTVLAYLCTPTDLHLMPKEAWEASLANFKAYSKKIFCILMNKLSRGKYLRKNARDPVSGVGGEYYIVNGLSVAQGPNYALAKRMQHWRAVVARSKNCIVSSNIAPATSTVSVVHNRLFAWAYEGMPYFKPYEIFAPATSNAVMTALLIFDINATESAGNPKTKLRNPNELFSYGGFHGGTWRCAYEVDSIGESSVAVYFSRCVKPYFIAGVVGWLLASYTGHA